MGRRACTIWGVGFANPSRPSLGHLPLELVQDIIGVTVASGTLKDAVSLRLVNHMFDQEVLYCLAQSRLQEIREITYGGIYLSRPFMQQLMGACLYTSKGSDCKLARHLRQVVQYMDDQFTSSDYEDQPASDRIWEYIFGTYGQYCLASETMQCFEEDCGDFEPSDVFGTALLVAICNGLSGLYENIIRDCDKKKLTTFTTFAADRIGATPLAIAKDKKDAYATEMLQNAGATVVRNASFLDDIFN